MSTRTSFFMADFSASDARSTKAHLQGRSARAIAYVGFTRLAKLFGRAKSADADFLTVSRYLFARRAVIAARWRRGAFMAVALTGAFLGAAVANLLFFQ